MTRDITVAELKKIRDEVYRAGRTLRRLRMKNPVLNAIIRPSERHCDRAWHLLLAHMKARGYKGRQQR
jgi:hypothetical protein